MCPTLGKVPKLPAVQISAFEHRIYWAVPLFDKSPMALQAFLRSFLLVHVYSFNNYFSRTYCVPRLCARYQGQNGGEPRHPVLVELLVQWEKQTGKQIITNYNGCYENIRLLTWKRMRLVCVVEGEDSLKEVMFNLRWTRLDVFMYTG